MNQRNLEKPLSGETGGDHLLAGLIDHNETYGHHIVEKFVASIIDVHTVVDLGAGTGLDLAIAKRCHPTATTIAVEAGREYAENLRGKVDQVKIVDIERETLPFNDETIDIIIANQVLEHTKEVFWIFHEVTRSLKVGGCFLIGVPNVASLHNRLLMLFGIQPTQHKLCSAHVRPFSKGDTYKFIDVCFPGGYEIVNFAGSQFYPFPRPIARVLSKVFPSAAFTIFFLLRKKKSYQDEFATYPTKANLQTNFYSGSVKTNSQYSE